MAEKVTFKGKELQLKGRLIKTGEQVPECTLTGKDLQPVKLSSLKGKYVLLLSVPSLDTPVCSTEARRFTKELGNCADWLQVVCVSMDLPFAQARWCAAEGVQNLTLLSDFNKKEFGEKFGLLIDELGLLARAVILIDPSLKVVEVHLVREITEEPDYKTIIDRVHRLHPVG